MKSAELAQHIKDAHQLSGGEWQGRCPCSDAHSHGDAKPSLSWRDKDDRILMSCKAGAGCENADIMARLGLSLADLFHEKKGGGKKGGMNIAAVYPYVDEHGAVLYEVVRTIEPDGSKGFLQRRPDGHGGWVWKKGDRQVVYRLDKIKGKRTVLVPEGEKDVETLEGLGFTATCNSGGAKKWTDDHTAQLVAAGVQAVVILADNDTDGHRHAVMVAKSCLAAGIRAKIVWLPDLRRKGDVTDWLNAGHTRDDLAAVIKATSEVKSIDGLTAIEPKRLDDSSWTLGHVTRDTPPELLKPGLVEINRQIAEQLGLTPEARDALAAMILARFPAPAPNGAGSADGADNKMQPSNLGPAQDGKEGGGALADRLVALADEAQLFMDEGDGETAYATVPVNGHEETWKVRSSGFRRWLSGRYYAQEKRAANGQAVADALATIEARAAYESGEYHNVHVRVAGDADAVYLDLCNSEHEVVEVTAQGWRVLKEKVPVKFRGSKGRLPLPRPEPGGSLNDLRPLINVREEDWVLIAAWLLMSALPQGMGSYPVLNLIGEHGSAKSHLAQFLRSITDPYKGQRTRLPREERDLMIQASNAWVVSLDNLSSIPPWLSDSLCCLSTGGGFRTRALRTDEDEVIFEVQRPVILNGINNVITNSDLLDRAIIVDLPVIPKQKRMRQTDIEARFKQAQPRILGGLLDAVSMALRRRHDVHFDELPRMADFAAWVEAAAPALGWEPGHFTKAYSKEIAQTHELAVELSLLGPYITRLVASGDWSGTATDLLRALNGLADEQVQNTKGWPKTHQLIGELLRRLAPNLRETGIEIVFDRDGHKGTRTIDVLRMDARKSLSAPSALPAPSPHPPEADNAVNADNEMQLFNLDEGTPVPEAAGATHFEDF